MFAVEPGNALNDEDLRERAKAGFRAPGLAEPSVDRVLAEARASASGLRPRFTPGRAARVGIVLGAAALLLVAVALQPLWRPTPPAPPVKPSGGAISTAVDRSLTAGVVLTRALAAVNATGQVLHVVALTEYRLAPVPLQPPKPPKPSPPATTFGGRLRGPLAAPYGNAVTLPRHRHGGYAPPAGTPPPGWGPADLKAGNHVTGSAKIFVRRVETEHWVDLTGLRRHSANRTTWPPDTTAFERIELLFLGRVRTKLDEQHSANSDSTWASETDIADPARPLGVDDIQDPKAEDPQAQLADTANPWVYESLLTSGALIPPVDVNGTPAAMKTATTLLGDSVVDGVPCYRLQVVNTFGYAVDPRWSVQTTIVADLRQSDYLPVRVQGWNASQTWVTTYRTIKTLAESAVPSGAFRVTFPPGTKVQVNLRVQPSGLASATPIPARWLGQSFGGLRSTGYLRVLRDGSEYESMRNPDSPSVEADNFRPTLGKDLVLAEYTKDGGVGNMTDGKGQPVLKVMTYPRTDPTAWPGELGPVLSGISTDPKTTWTTVGGHKALAVHREAWSVPDPPTTPRFSVSLDYLIVDEGDSTVMLQGASIGIPELERAANAMVHAK